MQYKHLFDLSVSKLQESASAVSAEIVRSNMQSDDLKDCNIVVHKGFVFGLYDRDKKFLKGTDIAGGKEFVNGIIFDDKDLVLVDDRVYGYLGVSYILIKEMSFNKSIEELLSKMIFIFISLYAIISIVGFLLAKLFLKPIQIQREKLNDFIRDTTHELNTPISALLMCADSPKKFDSKNINRIKMSAKRVFEIYSDLSYLFLENGEKKFDTEINLKQVVEKQCLYLEELANKKRIDFFYELGDAFYSINQEDFSRVANNLIMNAIKYTNMNGEIEVYLNQEFFGVKDSGIGIDSKELKHVFNRFHRSTTMGGGFGIGLNIVQRVCVEYGLHIDIDSKTGKGSYFKVFFDKQK
jgi:two-component system OmpR family sensor kinase